VLDTRPEIDFYNRSLVDLVELFARDEGTVLCGGTSYFLMKLYQAYGYVSGRMSVGFVPVGNHAVTLVQVKLANGQTDTLLEDAYSDVTAVDASGKPLGAKKVARLARQGQADQVYWQEGQNKGRDLLVTAQGRDSSLAGASWMFDPGTDSLDAVQIRPGVWKMHGSSRRDRLVSLWWQQKVAPSIAQIESGIPVVFASTFAFPIWVEGLAGEIFAHSLPPGNLLRPITPRI